MKFKLKLDERDFEVEVGDVDQRPIAVRVEGERFEVWPSSEAATPKPMEAQRQPMPNAGHRPSSPGGNTNRVYAPIPGVIVSIAVQPGQSVIIGQELCVLEAMKMRNSIRAARAGKIAAVFVSVEQTVKQRDGLLEYAA